MSGAEHLVGPLGSAEGPVWTGSVVLFSDPRSSTLLEYRPVSGELVTVAEDTEEANGLARDLAGNLYACAGGSFSGGGRCVVRYGEGGVRHVLASAFRGLPFNEPNDLVVDARARVWFTDPCYGDRRKMELLHEGVYRLDPRTGGGHDVTRVCRDLASPDGIGMSPDGSTLYVTESPPPERKRSRVLAFTVLADGSLADRRTLHDLADNEVASGVHVMAGGDVYVGIIGHHGRPSRIAAFDAAGQARGDLVLDHQPTGCCAGEMAGRRCLFVTTLGGHLVRVDLP
jgi:gluconolactonase